MPDHHRPCMVSDPPRAETVAAGWHDRDVNRVLLEVVLQPSCRLQVLGWDDPVDPRRAQRVPGERIRGYRGIGRAVAVKAEDDCRTLCHCFRIPLDDARWRPRRHGRCRHAVAPPDHRRAFPRPQEACMDVCPLRQGCRRPGTPRPEGPGTRWVSWRCPWPARIGASMPATRAGDRSAGGRGDPVSPPAPAAHPGAPARQVPPPGIESGRRRPIDASKGPVHLPAVPTTRFGPGPPPGWHRLPRMPRGATR